MEQKRAVTARQAERYRAQRSRKARSRILGEVVRLTDYNRRYAGHLLRNYGKSRLIRGSDGRLMRVVVGRRRKRRVAVRPRYYDAAVAKILIDLWDCFDQMCGKRLAAIMTGVLPTLVKRKKVAKADAVYAKLSQISGATIDRLLKEERAKRRLHGNTHTRPSTVLKNSVPIVISSELQTEEPGHYQLDLVGHDGGNPNGQFAFTLTAVELSSGWVELRGLLNKAHRWSKQAVESVKNASPVPVRTFHSDSDSAFINEPLQDWCRQHSIPYRRSRPYHCNDTCYVEQKNYNIVRCAVGYARYETEEEVALLAKLYENQQLLVNFFYPSMKLREKKRIGGRIRKRYDEPKTPARRLLDCPAVAEELKRSLRHQMGSLDPFVLKSRITRIQGQLLKLVRRKNMKIVYPGPSYPQAAERMEARLFGRQ
jgi:hypothetical protein